MGTGRHEKAGVPEAANYFKYDEAQGAIVSDIVRGRYLITPHQFLHIISEEYVKVAGKGAPALLYAMGFEDGKRIAAAMLDRLGVKDTPRDAWDYAALSEQFRDMMTGLLKFYNWAAVECFDVDLKEKKGHLRFSDHVFSRYSLADDISYCDWIRGYAAGIFSVMADDDMVCEEQSCMALGDDACDFILGTKEAMFFGAD